MQDVPEQRAHQLIEARAKLNEIAIRSLSGVLLTFVVACSNGSPPLGPIADDDWLHHAKTHSEQRFSTLTQINFDNVSRLGLAWYQEIPNARSLPATPLAVNGTLYYAIDGGSVVYAVDGKNGDVKWQYTHRFASSDRMRLSMGAHRGVAYDDGRVFYGTADGFLNALDAQTGELLWSAYTFPEFDRVYIGTSNGSPYDPALRSPGGGDNLFLCSIVALDADSGEYVWHYQVNPREGWDYKATMDIVLADLDIDGSPRKVLMQAPTNGFFYVIDRSDGKLISAEKWGGKVNWASHIDLETGRPVEAENIRYEKGPVEIWPGHNGAHNFQAMSFSPQTGLAYIPHLEMGMIMGSVGAAFEAQQQMLSKYFYALNSGALMSAYLDNSEHGSKGSLIAYDPLTQSEKWRAVTDSYWNGGTMATAGNLEFYGTALGEFAAYHAGTGEKLWAFDAGLGIISSPISYAVDGTQYVSLLVGYGASASMGLPAFKQGWKYGKQPRRLLTFALNGDQQLPPTNERDKGVIPIEVADFVPDPGLAELGNAVYHMACAGCHGMMLDAESVAPDLRESLVSANLGAFKAIVRSGVIARGMPEFSEFSDEHLDAMYHYVRSGALRVMSGESAEACENCPVGG